MPYLLLTGAGFSHNWGAPLARTVSGSLLADLHDDAILERALRDRPFEDAMADFFKPAQGDHEARTRHQRLQSAVTALFDRINTSLAARPFEFGNDLSTSAKTFLDRFDAIFTLNQDLLVEHHYHPHFMSQRFDAGSVPGMDPSYEQGRPPLDDTTKLTWRPSGRLSVQPRTQPYFKLHGSSNWKMESGDTVMIMGSTKTAAIARFPILNWYQEEFRKSISQTGTKLMVIGYSFMDEHINRMILDAYRKSGLQTYIVDPRGEDVLHPPNIEQAQIKYRRDIQDIKIIGKTLSPLNRVLGQDTFEFGELMRFFR